MFQGLQEPQALKSMEALHKDSNHCLDRQALAGQEAHRLHHQACLQVELTSQVRLDRRQIRASGCMLALTYTTRLHLEHQFKLLMKEVSLFRVRCLDSQACPVQNSLDRIQMQSSAIKFCSVRRKEDSLVCKVRIKCQGRVICQQTMSIRCLQLAVMAKL